MSIPAMMAFRSMLIAIGLVATTSWAAPMTVTVAPRTEIDVLIEAPFEVYLDGDIDSTSPELLSKALESIGSANVSIIFNSLGGNLFAGMKLGRIIRKYGANTNIGRPNPNANDSKLLAEGGCYSACALAYLGGYYRYISQGSEYGVHRFTNPNGPKATDLDTAQILSASIGNYIREMEVAPALFDLTVKAGPEHIYVLSKTEYTKLRVVNNGRLPSIWSIEANEAGMYLKGVQETWVGEGKAIFFCANKELLFYSIYTAGGKSDSIAKGGWVHSLFVDDDTIPLPAPEGLRNDKGYLNAMFKLTHKQYQKVRSAKHSIGHAMQMARDAPTFVGYHVDIDVADNSRIRSFIDNCISKN